MPRLLLVAGLLAAGGCGPAGRATVTGTVRYSDGSPVTSGEVLLYPADDPAAPSPVGHIQPDGSFALFTDRPGDGAPVGRYTVTVAPLGDEYNARNPRPIDPKYADPATSGLTYEVKPGTNTLDLTVTRPGQKAR
jgi:hypothetical protein